MEALVKIGQAGLGNWGKNLVRNLVIGAAACEGASSARLVGAMTVEQALDQLLSQAPCGWKMIAPGAVAFSAVARTTAHGPAIIPRLPPPIFTPATSTTLG